MGRPVIGAYQGSEGDCDAELEALGTRIGKRFFRFAQRVVSRKVNHWTFQTFAEYRGVPLYKAEFDDSFAIIAVEDDADQGISLTLMLALRFRPCQVAGKAWDGRDMAFIRDEVLQPRLQDYFE